MQRYQNENLDTTLSLMANTYRKNKLCVEHRSDQLRAP